MCDKINTTKILLFLLLLAGIFPSLLINAQENPEVKAIQLYNSGNFSEAEKILHELLEQNAESPIINYYYGATLTENGSYGENELEYLRTAGKNITPDRLQYYMAIQYHALENWDQALKLYNMFRISVPEMEQKELELDKKIQLCYNQVNPFTAASVISKPDTVRISTEETGHKEQEEFNATAETAEDPILFSASTNTESLPKVTDIQVQTTPDDLFLPREALPNLPGVKPTIPDGDPVQFQINNDITYLYTSQFQTKEGKNLYEKAKAFKVQQTRNLAEVEKLRTKYKNSQTIEDREAIASKIIGLENESFRLEEEIKRAYLQSRIIENDYWENAGLVSRNNFLMEQEKLVSGLKNSNEDFSKPEEEIVIDFYEPMPKASATATSSELTYKIQIGAFSKGVPAYMQRLYNKLKVIRSIDSYTDEKGVVVYTTGNLNRFEDAMKMQYQVKQEGIQDASIVPYYNGKRITLEQAKQMEANNDI